MKDKLKLLQKVRKADNRAIYVMATTPEGKVFMTWIDKLSGRVLRKTPDGVVDPYAMAYAAGQNDLIKQIKDMINDGQLAR